MEYLSAKTFSKIWNISERRIIKLCQEKRIAGAIKNGMSWEIPENTLKPSDKRNSTYKYTHIDKKVLIVNCFLELKNILENLTIKEGLIPEFINIDSKNLLDLEKYYEKLIYFKNKNIEDNEIIAELALKLNYESSIVLVDYSTKNRNESEKELYLTLKDNIGLNINTLLLNIENKENSFINYNVIGKNIIDLLTKFTGTSGISIVTDGEKVEFNKENRTKPLHTGPYYNAIKVCFKNLTKDSHIWCASTMLNDEWTDSPNEMKFRILNLEVANRGINFERIFIFKESEIKKFKKNKTLKIYMLSNIKTYYVNYDELLEKAPNLLKIVKNGWDGINKETLIVDLEETNIHRGYISKNKEEVLEAYYCFQELKKYAKDLKETLK